MAILFVPTSRKAEITLRGLRVAADSTGSGGAVFPWQSVSAVQSQYGTAGWYVLRETGEFHDVNGRRLLLRLKSERRDRLARRAQRRALRGDWRGSRINITEHLRDTRFECAVVAALALGCAVLGIVAAGPGMIQAWQSGMELGTPSEQFLLKTAVILGSALLAGLPLLVGVAMVRRMLLPTPARIRIDPIGIRCIQRSGEEVEARWRELDDLHRSLGVIRLDFKDGTQIVLADVSSRARTLLEIAREELLPEKAAAEARHQRSGLIRAAVMWVLGAAAVGGLAEYTAGERIPVAHPGLWVFLILVSASALVVAISMIGRRGARPGRAACAAR